MNLPSYLKFSFLVFISYAYNLSQYGLENYETW